jgi:hypothetical protein
VDVYATGLVLWEALVGRRLFQAANDGALLHMILTGAENSPRTYRRDVPEPIDQACMRALARKPDDRFPTAAAFAEALEQAAADASLRVAPSRVVAALVTEHAAPPCAADGGLERDDDGDVAKDYSASYQAALPDDDGKPTEVSAPRSRSAVRDLLAAEALAQGAAPSAAAGGGGAASTDISTSGPHSTTKASTFEADQLAGIPQPGGLRRTLGIAGAALLVGALSIVVWRAQSSGSDVSGTPGASVERLTREPSAGASPAATAAASAAATTGPSSAPSGSATVVEPDASGTATAAPGRSPRTPPTTKATASVKTKGSATSSPTGPSAPTSPTAYRPTQL